MTTPDVDFAVLYAQHLDFVWRNLRALGVPTADLDDAAQDTFVVAYRRREDFVEGASIRAWLYGIARRVASRQRRGGGRRARLSEAIAAQPREAPSLEALAEEHEAWRAATAFLGQLPAAQREAFWLTEVEGLTAAQAGAAVGVSGNTISSRLRAARLALARHGDALRARDERELRRAGGPSAKQRRRAAAAIGARVQALASGSSVLTSTGLWAGAVALAVVAGVGVSVSGDEPKPASPPPVVEADAAVAPSAPVPKVQTAKPPQAPPSPKPPPAAPSKPRHTPTPKPPPPSSLAEEAKAVRAIQAAVRRDPARAVALVALHHARFPQGVLTQEADALAVQAHCALGDAAKAQAHAAQLPATHAWSSGCREAPQKSSTNVAAPGEEQGK